MGRIATPALTGRRTWAMARERGIAMLGFYEEKGVGAEAVRTHFGPQ